MDAHQQHGLGLFSVDVAPPCGHSNFWPSAATVFKRVHVCLLATAHLLKSCIKMRISDPLMYLLSCNVDIFQALFQIFQQLFQVFGFNLPLLCMYVPVILNLLRETTPVFLSPPRRRIRFLGIFHDTHLEPCCSRSG